MISWAGHVTNAHRYGCHQVPSARPHHLLLRGCPSIPRVMHHDAHPLICFGLARGPRRKGQGTTSPRRLSTVGEPFRITSQGSHLRVSIFPPSLPARIPSPPPILSSCLPYRIIIRSGSPATATASDSSQPQQCRNSPSALSPPLLLLPEQHARRSSFQAGLSHHQQQLPEELLEQSVEWVDSEQEMRREL